MGKMGSVGTSQQKYKVQPIGTETINCIGCLEKSEGFVQKLSQMNRQITALTWWCHTKEVHTFPNSPLNNYGLGEPIREYQEVGLVKCSGM